MGRIKVTIDNAQSGGPQVSVAHGKRNLVQNSISELPSKDGIVIADITDGNFRSDLTTFDENINHENKYIDNDGYVRDKDEPPKHIVKIEIVSKEFARAAEGCAQQPALAGHQFKIFYDDETSILGNTCNDFDTVRTIMNFINQSNTCDPKPMEEEDGEKEGSEETDKKED